MINLFILLVSLLAGHFSGWQAGSEVSERELTDIDTARWFEAVPLPAEVFARMQGHSYGSECTVDTAELRYLMVIHHDGHGAVRRGEMVCNRAIASDLIAIFRQLYDRGYPIERMELIDNYGADDVKSMEANNTSCFNFRKVAGSSKLSAHSRGLAVDINPLYNPYVKLNKQGGMKVSPESGRRYVDRSSDFPYRITRDDLVCRLFRARGFVWGGDWRSLKDYQHFEKQLP